jgi:hypothetical protein
LWEPLSDNVDEGAEGEPYENRIDDLEDFGQGQLQPLSAGAYVNRYNHVALTTNGLDALPTPRLGAEKLAADPMNTDIHHVALGYKIFAPSTMQQFVLVYGGSWLLRQHVEHIKLCLAQGHIRSI